MAEKTISRRVCAVTGIANPVAIPLEVVPNATMSVSGGVNVTVAPGTAIKVLLGVGELNNWAVMLTDDPKRVRAAVVLKYPAMDVITPPRGTEKAKLMTDPTSVPVRSMIPPTRLMPVAELPKPIKLVVPTSPPAMVVKIAGPPEANGMIAPEPV
ncbi:hypothetical protein ABD78_12375, partial [Paenibacillus polymyxa]|nr:hypothetical protein [Paenibacillus polymyxa]